MRRGNRIFPQPIDTQSIKSSALNSPGATVASLIQTCKLNGLNPQSYLGEVLTRLVNGWPQSRIEELLPWAFKNNAVN